MTILSKEIIKILRKLTTPGLVQTVPFDTKRKVAYRLSNIIDAPVGWALNDKPWILTEAGRDVLGEKK
jgi:hypothetical protein